MTYNGKVEVLDPWEYATTYEAAQILVGPKLRSAIKDLEEKLHHLQVLQRACDAGKYPRRHLRNEASKEKT